MRKFFRACRGSQGDNQSEIGSRLSWQAAPFLSGGLVSEGLSLNPPSFPHLTSVTFLACLNLSVFRFSLTWAKSAGNSCGCDCILISFIHFCLIHLCLASASLCLHHSVVLWGRAPDIFLSQGRPHNRGSVSVCVLHVATPTGEPDLCRAESFLIWSCMLHLHNAKKKQSIHKHLHNDN